MDYKPLLNIVDRLRGEASGTQNAVLLATSLLTWQQLSQLQRVSGNHALTDELAASPRDAAKVLQSLGALSDLAPFELAAKLLDGISLRTASEILQTTIRTRDLGNLSAFDPSDVAMAMGSMKGGGMPCLPPEVCDLMTMLAMKLVDAQGSIYLPWDESGQLLGRCLKAGKTVSMEMRTKEAQHLAALIRAYFEWPFRSEMVIADPIRTPSFQDQGTLRRFDLVIAAPPFGARSDQWSTERDIFDRFPEKTNSLTVMAIRHVLAQTKGRAVIAVNNSVLFASGGERRLRKDLIDEGVVQAVIGLPNGLLADSNIPFTLLVLDKRMRHETVRFVNCDSIQFKQSQSRTRFSLTAITQIVALALGRTNDPDAVDVACKDLQHVEWNLLPSRYVMDANMSRVDKVMEQYKTTALEDIAEVIKPLAETEAVDPIDVLEVGAADIQGHGFIPVPSKALKVSGNLTRGGPVFLKPHDIVMVIKGSVGKVSIAPEDTPLPGPGGWVVGQSMAVVRLNKPAPQCMAMAVFFRSDIGQELLRRLAAGATIPFLQIRELRKLRVPFLGDDDVEKAAAILSQQEGLRLKILHLQAVLENTRFEPWCNTGASLDHGARA